MGWNTRDFVAAIRDHYAFWPTFTLVGGLLAGMWLDWLVLRRVRKKDTPPAILSELEIVYDPSDRKFLSRRYVSWFREEDYAAIRATSEDGNKMPSEWKEWLKGAEKMEKEAIETGKIVERIYIDPDTFPGWCKKNGVGVNREGRHKFIAVTLASKYRNQS